MRPRFLWRWAALAALALALAMSASAFAQSPTPGGTPAPATALPAHIHAGTCATLGAVKYPLTDVALAPEATPTAMQPSMMHASEVLTSVTTVDVALSDLLAGTYAINIHESAQTMQTSVACGEIVGELRLHMRSAAPPGLVIPLRELNNSGYAGVAWLEPTADGKTTVTIFLGQGLIGPGPMASS